MTTLLAMALANAGVSTEQGVDSQDVAAGQALADAATTGNTHEGNVPANQPANDVRTKAGFLKAIDKLGASEGQGANARPALASQIVEASAMGAITEDDAEAVFTRYNTGVAKAKGIAEVKQGSEKQQVSKIKTFIKLGGLASVDGRHTFAKTWDAYKAQRQANGGKPLSKSPFDALLSAARMQIQYPDEVLSDDYILTCIHPSPKDSKLEVDKLGAILASMDTLANNEETPCAKETLAMLDECMKSVAARIKDMGGTTAQKKQEAKAQAKIDKLSAQVQSLRTKQDVGSVTTLSDGHD